MLVSLWNFWGVFGMGLRHAKAARRATYVFDIFWVILVAGTGFEPVTFRL